MNNNGTRRKSYKTSIVRTKTTLDTQHQKKVCQIREAQKHELELKRRLASIEQALDALPLPDHSDHAREEMGGGESAGADDPCTRIEQRIKLIDEKKKLEKELQNLETDETNYLLNTADILFRYYDLLDKDPSDQQTSKQGDDSSASTEQAPSSSILNYFSREEKRPTTHASNRTATTPDSHSGVTQSRGHLLEKYLAVTDPNYMKHELVNQALEERCSHCGGKDIILFQNDGYMTCRECHTLEYLIVDHDKPSYKDPPKEPSYFAYKRVNHLSEWLSCVQARESTDIPEEVFDKILLEIRKQKITNMATLTHAKTKEILKKLRMNKYYEHIPYIISRLNGMPMPHLSPELEEKIRSMFRQIQGPFLKHSPSHRKNFLSYSYTIHKILELLSKDEYLSNFPLLKSREKLAQQDAIWKGICDDLGWQFIPSL